MNADARRTTCTPERAARGRRHGLGPQPRPPAERDGRRPLHRGRARARPRAARRPTTSSGSRTPPPTPRSGRCSRSCAPAGIKVGVLSNTIWPRAWHARLLRARRRPRPHRRRRLHQRDPVDQAVARRPSRRRWRRSASTDPARCVYVGDRLFDDIWGAQQRRHAGDPHPAQHHPGRAGRPHRGRARRGRRTGSPRSPDIVVELGLRRGPDCRFVQCRDCEDPIRIARPRGLLHDFARGARRSPPHRAGSSTGLSCPGLSGPCTRPLRGASREFPGRRVPGPLRRSGPSTAQRRRAPDVFATRAA